MKKRKKEEEEEVKEEVGESDFRKERETWQRRLEKNDDMRLYSCI